MRRENRLTSAREFRRILAQGKRASVDGVICFALPGNGGPARVGVTTSRKFGGAVARNKAKRLLREAARRIFSDLAPGAQVVLMATPGINGKSFQDVAEASRAAAKQATG
jgi:ribonuclease P protein component